MSEEINYSVIPVSVLDIEAVGKSGIRGVENHDGDSSRKNFSPFPASVATLCAEFFLRDSSVVVDPFAGWGERGVAVQKTGKQYFGFDVSPDAIEVATSKGANVLLNDSSSAFVPEHDGLLTCPPYWNLEKYAGQGLHSNKTWDGFLAELKYILTRFREKAKPGSTYCIVGGDWRSVGVYYDFVFELEKMLWRLDMKPHDKVILSRKTISKIKIMLPQAKRLGYTVKVHESLLVYRT